VDASKGRRGDSRAGTTQGPADGKPSALYGPNRGRLAPRAPRPNPPPAAQIAHTWPLRRFSTAGRVTCARTIPHRFTTGIVTAQLPHSRTIPHKLFCRLLPLDAKKCLHYEVNACIFAGRLAHRKAIMSNNENIENPLNHGSNPCRTANFEGPNPPANSAS
jgi:hypothetical protein